MLGRTDATSTGWRDIATALAVAIAPAACANPLTSPSAPPRYVSTGTTPVIQTLFRDVDRTEVGGQIDVAAVVSNAPGVRFEWSATAGTFNGSGPAVRWTAPAVAVPNHHVIRVDVVDRYTLIGHGRPLAVNARADASMPVHVNDSPQEVTKLAFTFINDFVHSERTAEYCVRNFSDRCRGKAEEFGDVQRNRNDFVIDVAASTFTFRSLTFNTPANSPTQATAATVRLNCRFVSVRKATSLTEVAEGICRMTGVYEDYRWRLCESLFDAPASSTSNFSF